VCIAVVHQGLGIVGYECGESSLYGRVPMCMHARLLLACVPGRHANWTARNLHTTFMSAYVSPPPSSVTSLLLLRVLDLIYTLRFYSFPWTVLQSGQGVQRVDGVPIVNLLALCQLVLDPDVGITRSAITRSGQLCKQPLQTGVVNHELMHWV
jgi:hypothetical protein